MASSRNDEVRAYFDRLAGTWNEDLDPAKVVEMLSQVGIGRGTTVLDVGSGTGVLIPFLLDVVGPEGSVCALDVSPSMLEKAKAKGYPHVRYVCAPVETMPLPDDCFDSVMCFNAFPHFSDKAGAIKEMARVLVRGGHLVIAHLQSRAALNEYHSHMSQTIAHDMLPDDAIMRSLTESAGLTGTRIEDGPSGYRLVAFKQGHPWP